MRSPTLLPIRMKAAETSASSAIADWTPLTVVPMSSTTAEIETFMIDVSTTSTNIAIASSSASLPLNVAVGCLRCSHGCALSRPRFPTAGGYIFSDERGGRITSTG